MAHTTISRRSIKISCEELIFERENNSTDLNASFQSHSTRLIPCYCEFYQSWIRNIANYIHNHGKSVFAVSMKFGYRIWPIHALSCEIIHVLVMKNGFINLMKGFFCCIMIHFIKIDSLNIRFQYILVEIRSNWKIVLRH